ncbi:hypothetical protein I6C02_11940, partial [Staphylococcus aureus]|nr:hypothetical protein [Staphylococcus aureus]
MGSQYRHYYILQYHVGHIQQIRQIQAHIKQTYPRLRVTGASFEAVGLPDCITQ